MDNAEVLKRLDELEKKIEATYRSVEKTRKYILTIAVISGIVFVLPLLALPFAISSLVQLYTSVGAF